MKPSLFALATISSLLAAGVAGAAEKTATIEVTGLYCSSCPYIAAQAVMDVTSAEIVDGFYDQNKELAQFVIKYDDEKTTLAALVGATAEFGYPARLIKEGAGDS